MRVLNNVCLRNLESYHAPYGQLRMLYCSGVFIYLLKQLNAIVLLQLNFVCRFRLVVFGRKMQNMFCLLQIISVIVVITNNVLNSMRIVSFSKTFWNILACNREEEKISYPSFELT